MGDVSYNFSRYEFACKCGCGFNAVDTELLRVLQNVRTMRSKPVSINSGCRCLTHNTNEGGYKDSKHMIGIAADFVVIGIEASRVQDYLLHKYQGKYGIGRYKDRTHIDVRPDKARWDER